MAARAIATATRAATSRRLERAARAATVGGAAGAAEAAEAGNVWSAIGAVRGVTTCRRGGARASTCSMRRPLGSLRRAARRRQRRGALPEQAQCGGRAQPAATALGFAGQ